MPYFPHSFSNLFTTGPVQAYERCWFLGDEFCRRSFERHFRSREAIDYNSYVKAHYDVKAYFGTFMNANPSTVGRFGNLVTTALSETGQNNLKYPFPRLAVVVPDGDILSCITSDDRLDDSKLPNHLED